jgi:uncharacterized cupredoxin-like copper-binding protein
MFSIKGHARRGMGIGAALAIGIVGLLFSLSPGTAGAASPRSVSVHITLRDFSIAMSRHAVPAGTPITFTISNRGKAMHEVVLERAGADDEALEVRGREYEADDIAPGTKRSITWIVPRAGEYQLACHMPGHFERGMKARLTVTPR